MGEDCAAPQVTKVGAKYPFGAQAIEAPLNQGGREL
jgi:hypothetical protein